MITENPICTNCGHQRLAHRIDGTCPMKGQPTKEAWACSQYAKAERIAANAKLKAEWEKEKFTVQVASINTEDWDDLLHPIWDESSMRNLHYRRKPEPDYVPWTAGDAKQFRSVWVRWKTDSECSCSWQITGVSKDYVALGVGTYSLAALFSDFAQLDGTPCGKLEASK